MLDSASKTVCPQTDNIMSHRFITTYDFFFGVCKIILFSHHVLCVRSMTTIETEGPQPEGNKWISKLLENKKDNDPNSPLTLIRYAI